MIVSSCRKPELEKKERENKEERETSTLASCQLRTPTASGRTATDNAFRQWWYDSASEAEKPSWW